MKIEYRPLLIIILIGLLRLLFTNPLPALFDSPEYVRLANSSFVAAISYGHRPSHPAYEAVLWILRHITTYGNLYIVGGILSGLATTVTSISYYLLLRFYFTRHVALMSTLLFSVFSIVTYLSTSLSVEPLALAFFITSLLFMKAFLARRKTSFALAAVFLLAISLLCHTSLLFWLPSFFCLPLLTKKDYTHKNVFYLSCILLAALLLVGICQLVLFYYAKNTTNESLFAYLGFGNQGYYDWYSFPWGTIRYMRNLTIGLLRDFSPLIVILACFGLYRAFRHYRKKTIVFFFLFFIPYLFTATLYTADSPGRRYLPLALSISLLSSLVLKRFRYFIAVFIYLIIIITPVIVTSSLFAYSHHPFVLWQKAQMKLLANGLYIQSHFNRPFTTYKGENIFLNEPGVSIDLIKEKIDLALGSKKAVYLESQAVFDPYLYYTGTTLQIYSLGHFGNSPARELFKQYQLDLVSVVDAEKRMYIYQLFPPLSHAMHLSTDNSSFTIVFGKSPPGQPILIYSKTFLSRILKQRQDYYDAMTWIWVILTNKYEPIGWTYADALGDFILPIDSEEHTIVVSGSTNYSRF